MRYANTRIIESPPTNSGVIKIAPENFFYRLPESDLYFFLMISTGNNFLIKILLFSYNYHFHYQKFLRGEQWLVYHFFSVAGGTILEIVFEVVSLCLFLSAKKRNFLKLFHLQPQLFFQKVD